jgi:hemerythrin-like domain-containing protein
MRTATGILRQEHEVIAGVLEVLDAFANRLDGGGTVEPALLTESIEVVQALADRVHHGKEEEVLFPMLEEKGLGRHGGPVAVMLREHDVGRAFLQAMTVSAKAHAEGAAGAGKEWARAALGYTQLMRDHIYKENNILFAIAERALSGAEQERLAAEFDRVETEKIGAGGAARLQATVARLREAALGRNAGKGDAA